MNIESRPKLLTNFEYTVEPPLADTSLSRTPSLWQWWGSAWLKVSNPDSNLLGVNGGVVVVRGSNLRPLMANDG